MTTPENEDEETGIKLNDNMSMCIAIGDVPIVDEKKRDRLSKALTNVFSAYGEIVDFWLPVDDKGATTGEAFIEFKTAAAAQATVAPGANPKLDAKTKLRVNLWSDFDKYAALKEVYEPPTKSDYQSNANLSNWLLDGRDQFVVRHGRHETQIFWNDPYRMANQEGRQLQYDGAREKARDKNWTELYVAWSPHGQYLATFHKPGLALWGGDTFEKLGRFSHPDVTHINFSPNEKYLVTSNGREKNPDVPCIQVWDIRSCKLLRGFERGTTHGGWPAFKWSHDDCYIARAQDDSISVYEVPDMGLLDKKSFKVPAVQDIQWSPSDNILAYWVPEKDNIPAKVCLIEIPSRKQLREKHLYNVADIKMHWQARGDYLCVKLARKKTKKTIVHNFEIFRLRQKDIPVEVLEIEDNIVAFAWEPVGSRFAIIHGHPARPSVSLYNLSETKLQLLKKLENRPASSLYWSPTGDYLVIAGLGDKNGALEFLNTNNLDNTVETDHLSCTDVEWDPSGRFVITSVTQSIESGNHWKSVVDNGYKLWSATGTNLASVSVDNCYQVLWRPRPKPLFTPEQIATIKAELKEKYWKKFELEDEEITKSQLSGAAKERAQWKDEWKAYRAQCDATYAEDAPDRAELRGGYVSGDEDNFVEFERVLEEEVSCETIER